MALQRSIPVTMWDMKFLSDLTDTIQDFETTYSTSPDSEYDLGKTLDPRLIDTNYAEVFDRGRAARIAYLQNLIMSRPTYNDHKTYTEPRALAHFGAGSTHLQDATYDGMWVSILTEYIALNCPAVYQRVVEYLTQASPAVYGSMQVILDVRFDLKTRLLTGNLYYHHLLDGPLPYFDDLIGSLYIVDETNPSYKMSDFILKWGEIHHNRRPGPWRLDQSIVIDPYMTQYGIFYETEESKALNSAGQLSSAIWLNDIATKYGKVHSPLTVPFEDWFVFFNMIPHGDLTTDILPRIPAELNMAALSVNEYKWYLPGETPWAP